MHEPIRQLIRTDGTVTDLPGPIKARAAAKLIGADTLDTVVLRHLGSPLHVMVVNDQGHDIGLPVNEKATALYHANCRPGTTHQILGDVVVFPDDDCA